MRTSFLAVTGVFCLSVAACTSSGTSTMPVERTPVATVSITMPSSIRVGQSVTGSARALDASGNQLSGRPISWQSSSTAIARVDATGVINGIAPGGATITATSEGVTGQASLDVTAAPPAPVASVSVALGAGALNPGQTTQATATTRDASNNVLTGRSISWSSSNTGIATVNASGLVTAVAVGSAQITATSEGQNGSATLTVTSTPPVPVASVSVSFANTTRNPGQTTQATAVTRDANNNVLTGRSISWSSSNQSVATVSASGLVTAVAVGNVQITATSEGQSGNASLTVAAPAPVPVASVAVSLAKSSLEPGQTTQATAVTRDANNNVLTGRVITWSSSNNAIATVSSSGLVTAIAVGTVQILAACEGQNGSANLTVSQPAAVASVTVSLTSNSLPVGLTTQATATTRDASGNVLTGRPITWSSSNNAVATVTTTGLVTAVAIGTADITASAENQSGSATLDVQAPGASNEPGGMSVVSDRPFNALRELGWDEPTNGQSSSDVSIMSDGTSPYSAPNFQRITYPAGSSGGSAPWDEDSPGFRYKTLYVSHWVRISSNWQGHPGSSVNKIFYVYTTTDVPSFYMYLNGSGTGPLRPYIGGQNISQGGAGYGDASNPDWTPNLVPTAQVTRGQWFHIELVAQMNSAGAADGYLDMWLDGVKVQHIPNIMWQSSSPSWRLLHLAPVWGGGGGTVANTMTMDFDNIYISGKN